MLCQDVTKGQLYRDNGQQKISAPYSPTLLQTKLNEKQVQKMTSISIAPPQWHRHTHTHLHTYTLTTPDDQVTDMLTKYIPCAYIPAPNYYNRIITILNNEFGKHTNNQGEQFMSMFVFFAFNVVQCNSMSTVVQCSSLHNLQVSLGQRF